MVRVGLVGCGTIGSQLALSIQRSYRGVAHLIALHDRDRTHAETLQRRLSPRPAILSLSELIRTSQLIIEAASADAAADLVPRALRANRRVLVMSVGGLLRNPGWRALARRSSG